MTSKLDLKADNTALLVIDVQNDFCQGGQLAVQDGDQVVTPINLMIASAVHIVATQDWHPAGHSSFATSHQGRSPFETIEVSYGMQTLWPDHCVQGSSGAAFHPELQINAAQMIIRKGFSATIDSYSAFFENDQTTVTGLHGYLQNRTVGQLVLAGLATDYCVAYSALDAARLGYDVHVVLPACRAIDLDGSMAAAAEQMRAAGITLRETLL